MINILITDKSNNLSDWLTFFAVIVALSAPFLHNWLSNKPKKSKLVLQSAHVCNQDNGLSTYYMGRLIIKNKGKFIAKSVEPNINNLEAKQDKKFFFPVPLQWTHYQISKKNPSIRDIYPNQSVYLDLFYFDKNKKTAKFTITAGKGLSELEDIVIGENKVNIVIYQKSGQVDSFKLKIVWDNEDSVPKIIV